MEGEQAQEKRGLYGQRPSKSADAVRRKEFAEIRAMPVLERIAIAFELGEALEALRAHAQGARTRRGTEA